MNMTILFSCNSILGKVQFKIYMLHM